MENASKALIIAASTMIAVLLFAFMFYMFKTFGGIASDTESTMSKSAIVTFNNKLDIYQTEDVLNINLTADENADDSGINEIANKQIKISDLFNKAAMPNKLYYNQALVMASQNLNTASDVLSAVNFAISNNYDNNNSYKYTSNFEKVNTVEIIIDLLGGNVNNLNDLNFDSQRYLVIEPNKEAKANYAFTLSSVQTKYSNNYKNKEDNIQTIKDSTENRTAETVSLYKMLNALRNTKLVEYNGQKYTVYEYYFSGECILNSNTGKIETVKFTLIKDKYFNS
jgi:hypothetical protein